MLTKLMTPNSSGLHPLTTAPLSEATARASQLDPEFVDLEGLKSGWGIKRSLAYTLLAQGLIKGVSLRRRGQTRGKRLIQVDSVRSYLREQMISQNGKEPAK
jgi:hypothetical protein